MSSTLEFPIQQSPGYHPAVQHAVIIVINGFKPINECLNTMDTLSKQLFLIPENYCQNNNCHHNALP